jgi:hypothetical protein
MPAHHDVEGRRAWRFVFVLVHVAFMIMNAAALGSSIRQRALTAAGSWELSPGQFEGIMLMDTWGTFGRLCLLAAGLYLTALMTRGDARVARYYRWYGGALLALEGVLNPVQLELWGIPRGTPWGWFVAQMALYAAALVTWVAYVWRSRLVRATFTEAPRTMGPESRLLIGLVAFALIGWPLALNNYVESTTGLAGWMSPKDTSAGMGLSQGILLTSVVIGLFVLMKNVCRMRNGWTAVLVPVSFVVLYVMYGMQVLLLHYGF